MLIVKGFCQYTKNCWENRPNVQGKENSSAQYAVKIVPHRVYVQGSLVALDNTGLGHACPWTLPSWTQAH